MKPNNMSSFIGTKQIKAEEMTKQEYYDYRDWQLPCTKDGDEKGYLVEYLDGGKPNHPNHTGYISWSPLEPFNKAYQSSGNLSFGHAIELAKQGLCIARKNWHGKGMWVALVNNDHYDVELHATTNKSPWLGMKTVDNCFVPWVASQTDILAEDWCVTA